MKCFANLEYSRNMRLISRQGGRPDGAQLMVHRGFAYIGHVLAELFRGGRARPLTSANGQHRRAARYLERPHLQAAICLLVINARDLFADRFADEGLYTRSVGGRSAHG